MRAWLLPLILSAMLIAACGQRGPLYIPGKPGDPVYDRQNRGSTPGGDQPRTQPGGPGQQPGIPDTNRSKREEES